jgi:hypothetical protein
MSDDGVVSGRGTFVVVDDATEVVGPVQLLLELKGYRSSPSATARVPTS